MQLIELRPLKPFVGTHPCSLAEADMIDDRLVQGVDGVVRKQPEPRKRFVGLIPIDRPATADEMAALKAGKPLPPNIEIAPDTRTEFERRMAAKGQAEAPRIRQWPAQRTVRVPEDVAASLVERGLAERVEPATTKRT